MFVVVVVHTVAPHACRWVCQCKIHTHIMAPQRGRSYGANLGSMGRNTATWSIRSDCLSNITSSWSRRKCIKNTTLPFLPKYRSDKSNYMYPISKNPFHNPMLPPYCKCVFAHLCLLYSPMRSACVWSPGHHLQGTSCALPPQTSFVTNVQNLKQN